MDVDAQFPNLSKFIYESKLKMTLNECGDICEPKDNDIWNLESSCWAVYNDWPDVRCGPCQTLKTLDEFIRRLPPKISRESIRDKICNKDQYLNTLAEASWALHFWDKDYNVSLELPVDPGKPKGKNADLVVLQDGVKNWFDVTSIQLSQQEFPIPTPTTPPGQFMGLPLIKEVLIKLSGIARTKYVCKFGKGVQSGLFTNENIGILLCVVKSEAIVLPVFISGLVSSALTPPPPVGTLDDKRPGLNLVCVHTLDPSNSGILVPKILGNWNANGFNIQL